MGPMKNFLRDERLSALAPWTQQSSDLLTFRVLPVVGDQTMGSNNQRLAPVRSCGNDAPSGRGKRDPCLLADA